MLKGELQALQQAIQDKDKQLAEAQQGHNLVAQLEAARQELANDLSVAQDALQV